MSKPTWSIQCSEDTTFIEIKLSPKGQRETTIKTQIIRGKPIQKSTRRKRNAKK